MFHDETLAGGKKRGGQQKDPISFFVSFLRFFSQLQSKRGGPFFGNLRHKQNRSTLFLPSGTPPKPNCGRLFWPNSDIKKTQFVFVTEANSREQKGGAKDLRSLFLGPRKTNPL